MPLIRPSHEQDLAAITRIYAHHVLNGTGTFETTPPSEADMTTRRADVLAKGLPWLVVEDDGAVVGFAAFVLRLSRMSRLVHEASQAAVDAAANDQETSAQRSVASRSDGEDRILPGTDRRPSGDEGRAN